MDITSYLLGKNASGGGSTPTLQSKEIEITENGITNVVADSGYDGLSEVEVTTNVSGVGDYLNNVMNYNTSNSYQAFFQLVKRVPSFSLASTVTSLSYAFYNCRFLTEVDSINNTSQVKEMQNMFDSCMVLTKAPNLDTSNVTNVTSMFTYCSALEDVPQYDLRSVTTITNMFRYCNNLTDESLDNILVSCISATSYTGTKTFKTLGFSYQGIPASRIEALPHYQDFIDAGWTIGY